MPVDQLDFIMGNPPFLGYSNQNEEQKKEILQVYVDENGKSYKTAGKIDYVSAWYFKAACLIKDTPIRAAFVSTNSIVQGEQVISVWKPLYERFGIHIDFARRSFIWNNDSTSKGMAHVHCVIIGFSSQWTGAKTIYSEREEIPCRIINPYLMDGPVVFLENRRDPICPVPSMTTGNRPADGGFLLLDKDEYQELIKKEPDSKRFIKKLVGAEEFINNKLRYCLWLVDATPADIQKMPEVKKRVEGCRLDRLGGADDRKKLANKPHLFRETKNPNTFMVVPATSSENRDYIPIGFLTGDTIPTNAAVIIPEATKYHFGVLTSSVHMAWMRLVAGRLKSDYRYSKGIVYNDFVWPNVDEKTEEKISKTAQGILDARAKYPDCSFAELYDRTLMPVELREAHQANDKAVLKAYGLKTSATDVAITSHLMKLYIQKLEEIQVQEVANDAVQKVIGKKAESVPDWMDVLRKQCIEGQISPDDLIIQGKARLKEEKKKAKEAEKVAKTSK